MKHTAQALALISALAAASGPALGQSHIGDRVIADVTACRSIADPDNRLACFDRAAGALAAAHEARDILVMDSQEVREKKRSLFGLRLPDINLFGRSDDERTQIAQIDSTVSGLSKLGRDRWTIRLADGSVWQTTEPARFDPEQGDPVTIKRAALGSFRGSFKGARSIRMERVR